MKKSHFSIRKIVVLSIFLAISVVVSYVESFIPIPIPGVKLGLANVIILVLLYDDTIPNAFLVLIMRIFIVGLIRGSIFTPTWFMSLSGGLFAFVAMLIFSRIPLFSSIGASVMGSISHCIGQIIVAIFMLSSIGLLYYLPWIMLLSIGTGIMSGFLAILIRKRYKEIILGNNLGHN